MLCVYVVTMATRNDIRRGLFNQSLSAYLFFNEYKKDIRNKIYSVPLTSKGHFVNTKKNFPRYSSGNKISFFVKMSRSEPGMNRWLQDLKRMALTPSLPGQKIVFHRSIEKSRYSYFLNSPPTYEGDRPKLSEKFQYES